MSQGLVAWNPRVRPSVVHVALGGDRFVEHPDPLPERNPIGFTLPRAHVEPLLWEGDNA